MNTHPTSRFQKKPRSRLWFPRVLFCVAAGRLTILRFVLLLQFGPPSAAPWRRAAGLCPPVLPRRHRRAVVHVAAAVLVFVVGKPPIRIAHPSSRIPAFPDAALGRAVFLLAAGILFLRGFKSRFNPVAVDYLVYPREVFIQHLDAYPVPAVVAGCVLIGAVWMGMAGRWFKTMWTKPVWMGTRFLWFAGALFLFFGPDPAIQLNPPHVSEDRTL